MPGNLINFTDRANKHQDNKNSLMFFSHLPLEIDAVEKHYTAVEKHSTIGFRFNGWILPLPMKVG